MNDRIKKLIESKLSHWNPSLNEMKAWWSGVVDGLETVLDVNSVDAYNRFLDWCSTHAVENGKVVDDPDGKSDGFSLML